MPKFSHTDLETFAEAVFTRAGQTPEYSRLMARLLVKSDMSGYPGHGISRLPAYVFRMRRSGTQGARWKVIHEGKAVVMLDAGGCPGQVACHYGMSMAIDKAMEHGVGIVTILHSSHTGRLADYVEQAAERGLIGIAVVSVGGTNVAPYGAMEGAAGTNPIAFGIPGRGGRHFVFDFATSAIANSEMRDMADKGKTIPEGALLDGYGRPTMSYEAFLGPPRGVIRTFGGYKGYGLSLVAELLGGALSTNGTTVDRIGTGGFGGQGVFLQAIRVEEFQPLEEFYDRVDRLASFVKSRKLAPGFEEIMFPGDGSRRRAARALKEGVFLSESTWSELTALAAELGVGDLPAPHE